MATETRKPTAAIAPFGLRMQPELRERIEAAAEAAGRSMNAEIVARLEASFTPLPPLGSPNSFETYADTVTKALAAEAAVQAIDAVLAALNAPEGTSDAERFQMLVRGSRKGFGQDDSKGAKWRE